MNELTREQARDAYRIGTKRTKHHEAKGSSHHFNLMRSSADRHRDGMAAVAEATVAAYLGLDLVRDAHGADDGTDVGGMVGVRWTVKPHGGLIIHPEDGAYIPQVLVIGWTYPLRCVGWITPANARLPEYWRENIRSPAYIVPQIALLPMEWLSDTISKHERTT